MPETGGVTVKDVNSHDFVIAYAAHLKRIGKIEVPKWADLVKTGVTRVSLEYTVNPDTKQQTTRVILRSGAEPPTVWTKSAKRNRFASGGTHRNAFL